MDLETTNLAIKAFLRHSRDRLEDATSVAEAAQACVETGSANKAVEISLDVEQQTPPTSWLPHFPVLPG